MFTGFAQSWHGSTASLARHDAGVVHGAVVELTAAEKQLLDKYEGSYDLISVKATVYTSNAEAVEKEVKAYVQRAQSMGKCVPFPSEQYLCAVSGTLAEHWPREQARFLMIYTVHDGAVVLRGEWIHPVAHGGCVSSLEAAAVEINLRKSRPWKMPRAANEFAALVLAAGVANAAQIWNRCVDASPTSAARMIVRKYDGNLEMDEKEIGKALEKIVAESGLKRSTSD